MVQTRSNAGTLLLGFTEDPMKGTRRRPQITQANTTAPARTAKGRMKKASRNGADQTGANLDNRVSKQPRRKLLNAGRPRGMRNRGNWCYRNAMLQCLLHQPAFCDMLDDIHKDCKAKHRTDCTTCALKRMRRIYWDAGRSQDDVDSTGEQLDHALKATADPNDDIFIGNDIHKGYQSCPFDFLKFLFMYMDGGPWTTNEDTARIESTLNLDLQRWFVCRFCGKKRDIRSIETRLGLESPISEPIYDLPLTSYLRLSCLQNMVTLECDCEDAINGRTDKWPTQTEYTRIVGALPEVLVLRANRFIMDHDENKTALLFPGTAPNGEPSMRTRSSKISNALPLDEWLNLGPYTEDQTDAFYRLDGVVYHSGPTVESGHYVAALRGLDEHEFYVFNDGKKDGTGDAMLDTVELLKNLHTMHEKWSTFNAFIMVYSKR